VTPTRRGDAFVAFRHAEDQNAPNSGRSRDGVSERADLGRWRTVGRDERRIPIPDQGPVLLALYDRALPEVFGYLLPRCGNTSVAEDLTSETFLAAVTAVQERKVPKLTTAWLVGVARHKLVDHWRSQERESRRLRAVADDTAPIEDPWDVHLDVGRAHEVLAELGAHHRAALTLRYLDGMSVPQVAEYLGRTVHATEALLVRARTAFRHAYDEGRDDAE
jgi:RNA polymerase sigma-70 factor, ECF subfamily